MKPKHNQAAGTNAMTTILTDRGDFEAETGNDLHLTAADAERITGWTLKPEGMCKGPLCVPLRDAASRDGRIDVAGFWRYLGNPVLSDTTNSIWVLGTGAEDRNESLTRLAAPDFTLPDLAGVPHTLSALRGKKVLLTTWASW